MLRINNSTKWDTKTLREIFSRCLRELRKTESKKLRGVTVKYMRNARGAYHYVGGWTMYNAEYLTITMPRDTAPTAHNVAMVFIHEFGHCLGIRHHRNNLHDYEGYSKGCVTMEHRYLDFIRSAFTDLTITEEVVVEKPKVDKRIALRDAAVANLKRAVTRMKRAKTLHAKWSKKVRYYDKILNT